MAEKGLEQQVKDLQEMLKLYQHEMERLQAVNEIQNLMSKYEYLHMTNRHQEVIELYAKNAPDARISMKETGYWEGFDAPNRAWSWGDRVAEENRMASFGMGIHPTTTPVIVVAGDGKTAKGVWIGTGFVADTNKDTGNPEAMWEWDRYGVDFIKEDGKWKFWHFHVYSLISCGWDDKWAEQFTKEKAEMSVPDDVRPDGPPIDSYPYRPDTEVKLIPLPPEPYETFDQTFSY